MKVRTLLLFGLLFLSCNSDREQKLYSSPSGYNLKEPVRFRVRESMQEISGIVLNPDEHNIIAINDEEGRVYKIDVAATGPYPSYKFGKNGDYEDICRTDSGWFVLKSNGSLYQVDGLFTDSVSSTHFKFPKKGKREFETTYYDSLRNSIVLICKNCKDDKEQGITSAYRFDLATKTFDTASLYHFNNKEIANLAGTDMRFFKPSAAAIHPVEKRLYIIASVNRLLVIADLEGHIQEAYNLKHRLFPQPEGLAFHRNGDMYISNEGDYDGLAHILKFTYKHK
ncbi:SdiA-regulated domain-containing protein [Chitinophaga sp. MM2321]|uniref:SdiA-regulated domain-containing protein n=1 Tax=Chitinophaga sp. MM2321 TaxID=3137178 RepID=UPI0032D584BA